MYLYEQFTRFYVDTLGLTEHAARFWAGGSAGTCACVRSLVPLLFVYINTGTQFDLLPLSDVIMITD